MMAVLLIGSTGNGKSTLGNYLLNPEFMKSGKQRYFEMANDNLPKTQLCSVRRAPVTVQHETKQLAVIDTPGLNEGKVKDFEHMIELIKTLKRENTIQACIFVVKFSLKIDQQYKDTIAYYHRLLPTLFENNVIIVVTDYASDERSVAMRKMQDIDDKKIIDNIRTEILRTTGMSFDPILFQMDCIPITESERTISKEVRGAVLSRIFSLDPIYVCNLRVAKTKSVMEDDTKKVKECNGRIAGYNSRLIEVNKNAEEALRNTQMKEKELTSLNNELINLKDQLREYNTKELITIKTVNADDSWKFLKKQTKEFEETTDCDIADIKEWTNGHCEIEITERSMRFIKGKVKGELMRGLYACITLLAQKRVKYEDKITQLRAQIKGKKTLQVQAQKDAREYQREHSQFETEIESLVKYMDDTKKEIERHATYMLSVEDACERLKKLTVE